MVGLAFQNSRLPHVQDVRLLIPLRVLMRLHSEHRM
jgi:hypothetical protein